MGISAHFILTLCSVGLSHAFINQHPTAHLRLVKRQAQYRPSADQQPQPQQLQPQYARQPQFASQPQYASQPSQSLDQQQVSPDHYNYLEQLQQLSGRPQQAFSQQYSPAVLQQSLQSTAPQSFQAQQPPRRPQIPEDQRILQESIARRPIINQEREDHRNQHLISLGIEPTALRRQQVRENTARLAAQQAAQQAAQEASRQQHPSVEEQVAAFFADAGPQQVVPQIQSHLVSIPQSIPVRQRQDDRAPQADPHQRLSYSQLSFGSTSLPKTHLLPSTQQQLVYQQQPVQRAAQYPSQSQPQPQQVSYETEYVQNSQRAAQQAAYKQQERTPQIVYHSPQQVTYIDRPQQPSQLPEQYLIETTKPEDQPSPVLIPKRQQFSYRPQASYQDVQASIAAQQQRAQYAQQQLEAATSAEPPSRSSIFVTTARTPTPKAYSALPEYRIPASAKQRPLSETELNALINAGFSVSPSPNHPEYQQYFRGLSKRQPPKVGRISLSNEDRQQLAKSGIRSLYKVQGEESTQPVRYVLALDNQKRNADKA